MNSNDMSIPSVEGARDVKGFFSNVRHKEHLWERTCPRVLLNDVSNSHHVLDILVRDFALTHTLFGMGGDEVTVLKDRLPERRDVKLWHALKLGQHWLA